MVQQKHKEMNEERKETEKSGLFEDLETNMVEESSSNDNRGDELDNDKTLSFNTKEELINYFGSKGKVIVYDDFVLTTPPIGGGGWDFRIIKKHQTNNKYRLVLDGFNMRYTSCIFRMCDIISKEKKGVYSPNGYAKEFNEIVKTINNLINED